MPVTTKRLGEALGDARRRTDLTQEQAARKLDVETSTLRKWEQGLNWAPIWRVPLLEDLYELPRGWIFRRAGLVDDATLPIEDLIATDHRIPEDVRHAASQLYRHLVDGHIT